MLGLTVCWVPDGLSAHGSLIVYAAFFDRSCRYNRPPEAPPFAVGLANPQGL